VAIAGTTAFVLSREGAPINIAVMPLENLGHDPSNDYFVDGLTTEIIRNLSLIDGLAVRSQTSSFALRGKPRDVREAGKQLDVDYIVEGSVLRAGQGLRIAAPCTLDIAERLIGFFREMPSECSAARPFWHGRPDEGPPKPSEGTLTNSATRPLALLGRNGRERSRRLRHLLAAAVRTRRDTAFEIHHVERLSEFFVAILTEGFRPGHQWPCFRRR
jgi:hypothetical protein